MAFVASGCNLLTNPDGNAALKAERSFNVEAISNIQANQIAIAPDGSKLYFSRAKYPAYTPDGKAVKTTEAQLVHGSVFAAAGYAYFGPASGTADVVHRIDASTATYGYDPSTHALEVPTNLSMGAAGNALVAWGQTKTPDSVDPNIWYETWQLKIGPMCQRGDIDPCLERRIAKYILNVNPVRALAVSADGSEVLFAVTGNLTLYTLATGASKQLTGVTSAPGIRIVWPRGGGPLVSVPLGTGTNPPRDLYLFDPATDTGTKLIDGQDSTSGFATFDPTPQTLLRSSDGKLLVLVMNHDVALLDVETKKLKVVGDLEVADVSGAALMPDDSTLYVIAGSMFDPDNGNDGAKVQVFSFARLKEAL